jgi:hypothetical protein
LVSSVDSESIFMLLLSVVRWNGYRVRIVFAVAIPRSHAGMVRPWRSPARQLERRAVFLYAEVASPLGFATRAG